MQVEHKTEKGTVLFVKVPNHTNKVKTVMHCDNNGLEPGEYPYWFQNIYINNREPLQSLCIGRSEKPTFEWILIGLTSEVMEETTNLMVDCLAKALYKNYDLNTGYLQHLYGNPLHSFKSLMRHLQVYEVNPLTPGDYPKSAQCENDYVDARYDQYQYDQAKERTGKWVVLFKSNNTDTISIIPIPGRTFTP